MTKLRDEVETADHRASYADKLRESPASNNSAAASRETSPSASSALVKTEADAGASFRGDG